MKYNIDDKEVEISDNDYLDEGNESIVYKYFDIVLKIYKKYTNKDRLTLDEVKMLKKFVTKRVLLPKGIIYDKDNDFIGYSLKYVDSYSKENIKRMKVRDLKRELELIKEDIIMLSNNKISLEDFHYDNLLYDGSIYIIDPGNFKVVDDSVENIYKENIRIFNYFFLKRILSKLLKLTKTEEIKLEELVDSEGYIGDILVDSDARVSSYIRGKVK